MSHHKYKEILHVYFFIKVISLFKCKKMYSYKNQVFIVSSLLVIFFCNTSQIYKMHKCFENYANFLVRYILAMSMCL